MVKIILKILIILLLAIFQISLMTKFLIWGAMPNLILIFAIALVIKNRFYDALLVGFLGGFCLDLASSLWFGSYVFSFSAILIMLNFLLLKTLPPPNHFIVFLIYFASFLFLELLTFLFIGLWPSWFILIGVLINSLWAISIYILIQSKLIAKEEIQLVQ